MGPPDGRAGLVAGPGLAGLDQASGPQPPAPISAQNRSAGSSWGRSAGAGNSLLDTFAFPSSRIRFCWCSITPNRDPSGCEESGRSSVPDFSASRRRLRSRQDRTGRNEPKLAAQSRSGYVNFNFVFRSETAMRIALDAMGGDHAPEPIVTGAVEAVLQDERSDRRTGRRQGARRGGARQDPARRSRSPADRPCQPGDRHGGQAPVQAFGTSGTTRSRNGGA